MLGGLVVSWLLMIIVSLATRKSHPVADYIIKAMDESIKIGPIPKEMLANADFNLAQEASGINKKVD
jgi:sodium/proline symporter